MGAATAVFGRSPGDSMGAKFKLAVLRALRTFIQGAAVAFGSAGIGTGVVDTSYWKAFQFAMVAAAITALGSFLQNVAKFLPEDPTQQHA